MIPVIYKVLYTSIRCRWINYTRIAQLMIFLILLQNISGCAMVRPAANVSVTYDTPEVLGDISYDVDTDQVCRLFINEEPYLVLSNDYGGNCLLLREYLLEEEQIYNKPGENASYYPGSSIDRYLIEVFLPTLPENVQDMIIKSTIEVTASDSLYIGGKATTTVQRKVFLLSFTELNQGSSRTNLQEGEPLPYFREKSHRVAYYSDGTPGSWWLRTPNVSSGTIVCGVSAEGIVGIGGIYNPNEADSYRNGVRPAFCLPRDTKIQTLDAESYCLAA